MLIINTVPEMYKRQEPVMVYVTIIDISNDSRTIEASREHRADVFFKYKPINVGIVFIVTTKGNLTLNYVLSTQTILFPIVLFRPRFIQ